MQALDYVLGIKKGTIQICFLDSRICDLMISVIGLVRAINMRIF